jgi:hypothetical protein
MRSLLAGVCCVTIAASCWLAAMSWVLHRTGYRQQMGVALLFVAQSLWTLAVLAGLLPSLWSKLSRIVLVPGAVGLAAAGGRAIAANLTNLPAPHFEGYALVIGAVLILQGVLTLWPLIVRWPQSLGKTAPIW